MKPVNNTAVSYSIASQLPLDPKILFDTLAELIDLGVANVNAYTYYDGMVVYCAENKVWYVWKEKAANADGAIVGNFQYPAVWIIEGIDYGNKIYNFIPVVPSVVKPFGSLSYAKASGNTNLLGLEPGDKVFSSFLANGDWIVYGKYVSGTGSAEGDYDEAFTNIEYQT